MLFSYVLKFALLSASAVSAFVLPLPRQAIPPGLSPECYNAGSALINSPIAQCFNVEVYLQTMLTPMDQSWVGPIDTWLQGMCSQAPCKTDDLVAAYQTFTTGCHKEFAAIGVTAANLTTFQGLIPKYYPLGRELECSKDPSNPSAFCVTTLLTATEKLIGVPLSPESLGTHAAALFATGYPKEILCTECTKGFFTSLKKAGLVSPEAATGFAAIWKSTCGSDLGV